MIEKGFTRLIEVLWFPILFVIVWSAVLGLPNVPAWNEFVTWFGTYLPGSEFSMQAFFGDSVSWITSFNTIDFHAIRDLVTGQTDVNFVNVLRAVGFIANTLFAFLPTIAMLLYMGAMSIWFFFGNVAPLISAFVFFLGGNLVSNGLPGVVSPIDWGSISGAFGYPDQSFVCVLLPSLLVG